MNPYCWYCDRYVQEEPDHFNDEGCCAIQIQNHIIEREQSWKEVLNPKPLTDGQMCQVECQIKQLKIDRRTGRTDMNKKEPLWSKD